MPKKTWPTSPADREAALLRLRIRRIARAPDGSRIRSVAYHRRRHAEQIRALRDLREPSLS